MRNITEIIDAAGGQAMVAAKVGLSDGVRKWLQNGIPEPHWHILIGLAPSLSPDELYQANRDVRAAMEKAS